MQKAATQPFATDLNCLCMTQQTQSHLLLSLHTIRSSMYHLYMLQGRAVLELLRAYYTDSEDYKEVLSFNHSPSNFDFNAQLAKSGLLKPLS